MYKNNIRIDGIKTGHVQGISGLAFPYGATGMISLGDGFFYFSRDFRDGEAWGTTVGLYEWDAEAGFTEK